jgi:hypothetical protein
MRIFPFMKRQDAGLKRFNLADIRIASPCPSDWNRMAGDERVRHCSECNLNVYNLSAMTEREIKQLITVNQEGRLCTRFYRRQDGTMLTQDCPWSLRAMRRKVSRLASAALTALMSLTPAAAKSKSPKAACECVQIQQKDSGIKLTVADPDGAVIPNSEIKLQDKSGKRTVTGSTGPDGEWNISKIAPGGYALTVKSAGFRDFKGTVNVRDGVLLELKLKLPVAAVNQTVEVQSTSPAVMGGVGITTTSNSSTVPILPSGGQRMPMRR